MRRNLLILIALVLVTGSLPAQEFASYYQRNNFLMGSAGSFDNGLLGYANPASNALLDGFNARYYWTGNAANNTLPDNWGFFAATPALGFNVLRQEAGPFNVTDYNITLSGGDAGSAVGFGYTWSRGDKLVLDRERLFSVGILRRPVRQLSIGIVGNFSVESGAREGIFEAGLRPLPTDRLTLFADLAIQRREKLSDAPWSAGAALEVLPGINITGRYFDSEAFTVGLSFDLGGVRAGGQGHYDANNERAFNTYSVGIGDYKNNIFSELFDRRQSYLSMTLKGTVDYQKYKLFDDGTRRFMEILTDIRDAVKDPRISLLALNLSAMRIYPEHAWELREELKAAQAAGKQVIIFIDNAGMTGYHLASVADVVMMDPEGSLQLPGFVAGRTFLKGTLAKMGIGFDEWRFFKYKSAAETFSRDAMSEADREQRHKLIADRYDLMKKDVLASRSISAETFDGLIDEQVYFMPEDALKTGLVDTLVRWSNLDGVIKELTGSGRRKLPRRMLRDRADASNAWGLRPQVAVVYALGACAMDSGIKARQLEKKLLGLAKNDRVKAIVLRVDSPGGDGMASDYVAEALKKCREKKPVIISQGQVAASGGYWISMYGDKIVAGPGTITGSIGVIAGWLYNTGLTEKLGMSADHVKVGKHADLGFGVTLPLLGIRIPERNLTPEERQRGQKLILGLYDKFVKKVATGRGLSEEKVREIAEGQVYSGSDGKKIGLVDKIGGMFTAIEMAGEMAGLAEGDFDILEVSQFKGLFNSNFLSPITLEERLMQDPVMQFIKLMSERPGYAYPMLKPGDYPEREN